MTSGVARRCDVANDLFECSGCKQLKPKADFSKHARGLFGLEPRCRKCNQAKNAAAFAAGRAKKLELQRAANLARLAADPEPEKPAPTFPARTLTAKRPTEWPADPIEACVFVGMACDASEGRALINELNAANACGRIVRGYSATVGRDATGLVRPRFSTRETAAMWTAIVMARTGRREAA